MNEDIKSIISAMMLEEKAELCSGFECFSLGGIERLDIPVIGIYDGPHGLRKQQDNADIMGINASIKATCFPSGATLACSWDKNLMRKVGEALGKECRAQDVSILLGPAINIKRSPLCGRNFEYLSEDPFLTAELATGYIHGLQSQNIGASVKHFAANNQENMRLSVDVQVDERTLRESYLAAFEGPIKNAKPWTVMSAYNKVNGTYCSENTYLLKEVLRNEWGFDGLVVSDWGAVAHRVEGIKAGLDMEMPPSGKLNYEKIISAVNSGLLDISELDEVVERILRLLQKSKTAKEKYSDFNLDDNSRIAKETATECMVLLKNEDNILPLSKKSRIAVIGSMAKTPRYQGAGSSFVNAVRIDDIYEEITLKTTGEITFSKGYDRQKDIVKDNLLEEAEKAAADADVAIVFAGLTEEYESEGYDRTHMRMPDNHVELIRAVSKAQKNTVVILLNGSPVEMPWIDNVKGIFEAYLGGQALGGAIADLLFGDANPSGKLAETFPKRLNHNPSYINFPGAEGKVEYKEGCFIGYRYYDIKEIAPLFPFGYGLSYTSFAYTDISIDKEKITDIDTAKVFVTVKNTGSMAGKEIIQLYVEHKDSKVIRPIKELKGFEKVYLELGEEKTVTFTLNKRSFAYYNTEINDWYVESKMYNILIGSSSQDILLKHSIYVESTVEISKEYTRYTTMGELMQDSAQKKIADELIGYLSVEGALLYNTKSVPKLGSEMLKGLSLCSIYTFSNASFTEENLQDVLRRLNNKNNDIREA